VAGDVFDDVDDDVDEEGEDEDPEDGDASAAGFASVLVSAGESFFFSPLSFAFRESLR
jgi:hypothetical protein